MRESAGLFLFSLQLMDYRFKRPPGSEFLNGIEEQKSGRCGDARKKHGSIPIITHVATGGMMLIRSIRAPIRQGPGMRLFLSIAIISEVIATSALKSSNGFTQLWPSLVEVAGYAAPFFFLSLILCTIP